MGRPIITKKQIRTDRLVLRPYCPEDRDRLADMLQNPEITKTFMVPDYPETEQYYDLADKLIRFSQPEDRTHLEYGVYLDEYMIGFINDCGFDDSTVELGYVIDPDYSGHGYATEAVRTVIGELGEMGFKKIRASFFEGNTASRRVMEKCGMHPDGTVSKEAYRGRTITCFEYEKDL